MPVATSGTQGAPLMLCQHWSVFNHEANASVQTMENRCVSMPVLNLLKSDLHNFGGMSGGFATLALRTAHVEGLH